ncbi:hypothetical protein HF521_005750, partial [Silurus meridionalis]
FQYLGSAVQRNGECVREVKKRVQAGWSEWRRVIAGVICDRRISARGKVYKRAGGGKVEDVAIFIGVTRMDMIRNQFIRGNMQVGRFGDKVREMRLRRFGHVQRMDMGYIGRRMVRMKPQFRRKRERPRRRFMNALREDMKVVGLKEADAHDR